MGRRRHRLYKQLDQEGVATIQIQMPGEPPHVGLVHLPLGQEPLHDIVTRYFKHSLGVRLKQFDPNAHQVLIGKQNEATAHTANWGDLIPRDSKFLKIYVIM